MVQAMEMNDKLDETEGMADGDEGNPGGVPLPTPAQLNADLQSAHAALDEEEEQDPAGSSQAVCTAPRGSVMLLMYDCMKQSHLNYINVKGRRKLF